MTNIIYKELEFDKEAIKELYLDNEWYAYTHDIESLYRAILNSQDKIGAYVDDKLVGLIRTVTDYESICYIQDVLILKEYHRKGIGKTLMQMIFDKYQHIRQICLMTDLTDERNKQFYESIGMVEFQKKNCVGFSYNKQKSTE